MAFFSDLLKKWFYTNSSSAASSDARIPLLNANGTPKGSDTMANLASVLGANICHAIGPEDERNPTGSYAILYDFPSFQFLTNYWDVQPTFLKFRKYVYTSGWSDWHDVYSDVSLSNATLMGQLANALGENTVRYYVCDRYNQGSITDVFCSYFDQELPSSEQPVIVKVRSNTIGMAIGIKVGQNYGGFLIIGYDGVIAVIKVGGSWITKQFVP